MIAMLLVFESSSSVMCPDRPRPEIQPSREEQFQGSFGVQGEKRYTEGPSIRCGETEQMRYSKPGSSLDMGRRGAYATGTDWHAKPLDTV